MKNNHFISEFVRATKIQIVFKKNENSEQQILAEKATRLSRKANKFHKIRIYGQKQNQNAKLSFLAFLERDIALKRRAGCAHTGYGQGHEACPPRGGEPW